MRVSAVVRVSHAWLSTLKSTRNRRRSGQRDRDTGTEVGEKGYTWQQVVVNREKQSVDTMTQTVHLCGVAPAVGMAPILYWELSLLTTVNEQAGYLEAHLSICSALSAVASVSPCSSTPPWPSSRSTICCWFSSCSRSRISSWYSSIHEARTTKRPLAKPPLACEYT